MHCSASLCVSIFSLNLMHTVMFTVLGFLLFSFFPFFGLVASMGLFGLCSPNSIWQKRCFFFMWQCGNCFVWDVGFILLSQICMVTVVDNHVG